MSIESSGRRVWWAVPLVVVVSMSPANAQEPRAIGRTLTLEEAVRLATETSEQVAIARAGVLRARGEEYRARSEFYPQLLGSASYTRTLASEFDVLSAVPDRRRPSPENTYFPDWRLTRG